MIEDNDISQANKLIAEFGLKSLIIGNASQQMTHYFLEVLFNLQITLNLLLQAWQLR
jgi:hypothetical protein